MCGTSLPPGGSSTLSPSFPGREPSPGQNVSAQRAVSPHSHRRYRMAIAILLVTLVILGGVALTLVQENNVLKASLLRNPYAISSIKSAHYWSGYTVCCFNGTVSDVRGTWRVPQVTCSSNSTSTDAAGVWVGIDGALGASNTIEQAGTTIICQPGSENPAYYAFFQWYPSPAYGLKPPDAVSPGDLITAEVHYVNGVFVSTISDESKWTFQTSNSNIRGSASRGSAEWIVEAPRYKNSTAPLANFDKVFFSQCSATANGTTGPMGSFPLIQDTMVSSNSTITARPVLPLWNDGTSFSVWWISPGP